MLNPCNENDQIAIKFLKNKKRFTDRECELYLEKVAYMTQSGEDNENEMYKKAYNEVIKERL